MTQEQLNAALLAIAEGEQEPLSALYKDCRQSVFLLAASITGQAQMAEDVTQEVFLVIRACAPRYRANTNPRAFLYGVTRNVAKNMLRKAHDEIPDAAADSRAEEPPAFEKGCLDGIVASQALEGLSSPEYQIAVLHIFGELKLTEVAKYLQIPYGTVLWRYNEAKKKLRRFYEGRTSVGKETGPHE